MASGATHRLSNSGMNQSDGPQLSPESLQASISVLPRHVVDRLLGRAAERLPGFAAEIHYCASRLSAAHSHPGQISRIEQQQPSTPSQSHAQLSLAATQPLAVSKPTTTNETNKRAGSGDVVKPAAKRAKNHKPLDFEKLEDRAWTLMNKSTGWVKAEEGIENMIPKIVSEVETVSNLEVKHTALITLGGLIDQIFRAEPSRKAREVRNGGLPVLLFEAMIGILEQMSSPERSEFISSDKGVEWKEAIEFAGGHGRTEQVEDVFQFFEEMDGISDS